MEILRNAGLCLRERERRGAAAAKGWSEGLIGMAHGGE